MNTMNTIKTLAIAVLFIGFTSCDSDDDDTAELAAVASEQVTNLSAPVAGGGQGQPEEGAFTKFDFATGMATTSETDWDIAFRGTAVIVNGGVSSGTVGEPERNGEAAAYIATGLFSEITTASGVTFTQDAADGYAITQVSDEGWYNYNFMTNIVAPIPGRVVVFKTRDGKYAKVEILSYYLDQDSSDSTGSRYYTFNYVYNPNEGETSLE